MYDDGSLQLTTHRIIWDDESNEVPLEDDVKVWLTRLVFIL